MSPPWTHSESTHVDSRESTEVHGFPIFGELSIETAATPPNSTLLSNLCSATLAISWVPDEIWPIQITRGPPWTHVEPRESTADPL